MRGNSPLKSGSVDVAGEDQVADGWPDGIRKDSRLLSSWNDPVVRVDLTPRGPIRVIDFSRSPLPSNRAEGGPFDHGLVLSDFPHWFDAAKGVFAIVLSQTTKNAPLGSVLTCLSHIMKFFAWCVEQRVYKLSALTKDDIEFLLRSAMPYGWRSVLAIDERLETVLRCMRSDDAYLNKIVSFKADNLHFKCKYLSRELEVPIEAKEVPLWFKRDVAGLVGVNFLTKRKGDDAGWRESSFKTCFASLNKLYELPAEFDRLNFLPFDNARGTARLIGAPADARTPNLPIEEAAKLLKLALKWVYVRGEGLLKLLLILKEAKASALARELDAVAVEAFVSSRLFEAFSRIQEKYDLPILVQSDCGKSKNSIGCLVDFIQDLQTAVMVIVAINQARRKNEILGEKDIPWGLYSGCIVRSDPYVEAYELNVYIEKSFQDWRVMSASKLTADAIGILERVCEAFGVGGAPVMDRAGVFDPKLKLFVFPALKSEGVLTSRFAKYVFEKHSCRFFDETGVSAAFKRTHIFRRLFALLYMYRWHHPSLQALSEYLCHLDLECTRVYVADEQMRAEANRIGKIYRARVDCFPEEEMKEAEERLSDDLLASMLSGGSTGGPMTRRVRKFVRKIAHHVEFDEHDLRPALNLLKSEMYSRGYRPTPFKHGVCWAGGKKLVRQAKCGDGISIHRELASIGKCHQCPYHSTSQEFLKNVERELSEYRARMADSCNELERTELLRQINSLCSLIEHEKVLILRSVQG